MHYRRTLKEFSEGILIPPNAPGVTTKGSVTKVVVDSTTHTPTTEALPPSYSTRRLASLDCQPALFELHRTLPERTSVRVDRIPACTAVHRPLRFPRRTCRSLALVDTRRIRDGPRCHVV